MDRIRFRMMLDVTILAKQGWTFNYNDDGQLTLTSANGEQDAQRNAIMQAILNTVEHATLVDDTLAWHVAIVGNTDVDDTAVD